MILMEKFKTWKITLNIMLSEKAGQGIPFQPSSVTHEIHRHRKNARKKDVTCQFRDFPGAVVKNLPASAGDTGSIPGPGRSLVHMLRSN